MISDIDYPELLEFFKVNTTNLIKNLIMIISVVLLAYIVLQIISKTTGKIIQRAADRQDDPKAKTLITLLTLLRSVSRYGIYFVAFAIIINQLGYGSILTNVVTMAGVGTLVISLGAQSVISDMVVGAFILFENQFSVGDYIEINGYVGTVTAIAMRCTYLETWKGEKVIIPNGQIKTVINYSGPFNMAIVDIPTPYEQDSEKVLQILKDVAFNYYETHKTICYDKPSVVAINSFDDSSVKMSIYLKAKKRNHFTIQRDLKMAVKKRFDEEGISIPYNQIVVHHDN